MVSKLGEKMGCGWTEIGVNLTVGSVLLLCLRLYLRFCVSESEKLIDNVDEEERLNE